MGNKFQLNFGVRAKNKTFWISLIPATVVFVQAICATFGINIELSETQGHLVDVVNSLFVILTLFGIVNDPTTKGFSDSDKAMKYEEPKERGE